jgi:hypothetical protein
MDSWMLMFRVWRFSNKEIRVQVLDLDSNASENSSLRHVGRCHPSSSPSKEQPTYGGARAIKRAGWQCAPPHSRRIPRPGPTQLPCLVPLHNEEVVLTPLPASCIVGILAIVVIFANPTSATGAHRRRYQCDSQGPPGKVKPKHPHQPTRPINPLVHPSRLNQLSPLVHPSRLLHPNHWPIRADWTN